MSEAESHLSMLNLYSNILGLFASFIVGYLCDKIAIYKIMTVMNIIILSTWPMLRYDINNNRISTLFNLGYIIINSTIHISSLLGNVLIGKICSEHTRGTIFGFTKVFGSSGVCIL